jgi:hypothetical protein
MAESCRWPVDRALEPELLDNRAGPQQRSLPVPKVSMPTATGSTMRMA